MIRKIKCGGSGGGWLRVGGSKEEEKDDYKYFRFISLRLKELARERAWHTRQVQTCDDNISSRIRQTQFFLQENYYQNRLEKL